MEESNYTYSEEHRHRCEVRQLLRERRLRGKEWLRQHLSNKALEQRRYRLEFDILDQWKKGNTGENGIWL